MKINISNYDSNTGGKEINKILSFVNWSIQAVQTLTRVLRGNIELDDNINGSKTQVRVSSGVKTTTNITGSIYGITPMRIRGASLDSFEWGYNANGSIYVTCYFKNSETNIVCDLYVWRN